MKKSIYVFSIAAASLFLVSCGGTAETEETTDGENTEAVENEEEEEEEVAEPTIAGTWKLTDMDLGIEIPEGQEEMFADMKATMIENTSYQFNEDGTMTAESYAMDQKQTVTGTYVVEGDQLKTTSEGKEDSINIVELTEDKLVLGIEDRGSMMTMTFAKQ